MIDEWNLYNNFRVIEDDFIKLLRYVELKESNYQTTSAEILKILLAACSFIERSSKLISEEIGIKLKKTKSLSIASEIYRITFNARCPLTNLRPKIQNEIFNPWKVNDEIDNKSFEWWDAYNSSKHNRPDNRHIEATFKHAIDSVAALFVVTIFLTSKTRLKVFWYEHDYIKITTEKFKNPPSIYNCSESFRKQIWPDFQESNDNG